MATTRTTETTRQLHDDTNTLVTLQAWKIERLAGFGACYTDGEDRWSHTATVTLYTDGVYGVARGNRHDSAHTRDLIEALR